MESVKGEGLARGLIFKEATGDSDLCRVGTFL